MSIVDDFKEINRHWRTMTGQSPPQKWGIWFEGAYLKCWCLVGGPDLGICPAAPPTREPDLFSTKAEAEAEAAIAQYDKDKISHTARKYQ